jgi:hypothetical protein
MMKTHDSAQLMIIEVVIFAATMLLALIFIYQLSPSAILSDKYVNNLKIDGDNALTTIYLTPPSVTAQGYPTSKLVHYIIINDYIGLSTDLRSRLTPTVLFNIYVSDGIQTKFWCNGFGDPTRQLQSSNPVTICHYIIAIHPRQFTDFPESLYVNGNTGVLTDYFPSYNQTMLYDVLLEMWYQ